MDIQCFNAKKNGGLTKYKFSAILERHSRHRLIPTDETLYLLTVFDALKVILCITLFFAEISMHTFAFSSFEETVGSHLKLANSKQFFYRKKGDTFTIFYSVF